MRLNPQRARTILELTQWPRVETGSLNLEVTAEVVAELQRLEPLFFEDWRDVQYPPRYATIPQKRGGYRYFAATASHGVAEEDVLVRIPALPVMNRVELFAPISLKLSFALKECAALDVVVPQG